MRGITKRFGSIVANNKVDLTIEPGEILALLGENGSGKTTLMNMLSGIYFPDEGHIYVKGEEASISSPKDAYKYGIGMIHQHFKLVDVFTVIENVALGIDDPIKSKPENVEKGIRKICELYGFEIDPKQKVYNMNVSQKQTLEIIKVLYRGADVLILDEPTAVLTPQETDKLFSVIRNMKNDSKSIVIITHKLHEVLEISDKVAILRKGEYIATVNTSESTETSLTEMMVGQKIDLNIERPKVENRVKRLTIEHLTCYNKDGVEAIKDVSFTVFGGEILGIAGISGCGQKELLEAIAGLQRCEHGSSITYHSRHHGDQQLIGKSPKKIRDLGISLSFVPEDRLGMGLVGSMGMAENMMLKTYNSGSPVFIHKKPSKELAEEIRDRLKVVTPDIGTPVRKLSGGNVQKVLVGREISAAPSVLLTAYAVRGLDINTSYAIYDLLNEQKKKGVAVVYVGEDLDVLLELSDRILVLCDGRINGMLKGEEATKEQVGLLMTRLNRGMD
ncbi:MAG: ABC transporter ATP-binding protein [Clostridia bacterium]|nr:ABC transporter ATP-binding protein [Clostridia bacterium]